MRKIIFSLFLGISFLGYAQDFSDWQIGINANPFIFQRFRPSELPVRLKQDFPNGFATGITLEKGLNEKWSIESGANFSWQNEKYGIFSNEGLKYVDVLYKFQYLKIPMTINYTTSILKKNKLIFYQGFQISNLSQYSIFYQDPMQTIVVDNIDVTIIYNETNETNESKAERWFYEEYVFGLIGGIGVKKNINEKITFSAKLIYEYDLTDAEYSDIWSGWGNKSNNFRIGFDFGMQYHFNFKNNRQSSCPK